MCAGPARRGWVETPGRPQIRLRGAAARLRAAVAAGGTLVRLSGINSARSAKRFFYSTYPDPCP